MGPGCFSLPNVGRIRLGEEVFDGQALGRGEGSGLPDSGAMTGGVRDDQAAPRPKSTLVGGI